MNAKTPHPAERQHIFGPVPSRRLGRSLGVDLVPYKTCSYDCIYCQLGRTTNKTIQPKQWYPVEDILSQLKEKLHLKPNYITLSGSGEPALYSQCDRLIKEIKKMTDIPVAVLTNSSLLWVPQVRASLMHADLVIPSLDAGSEEMFDYVNRPHPGISFKNMLYGLIAFRRQYKGPYWLEVFLVAGVSTTDKEIQNLKDTIEKIQPDKVQINTVTRPPAETFAEPVPASQLETFARQLSDKAEIITEHRDLEQYHDFLTHKDDILALLKRRPCDVEDIVTGLGLHQNEVLKYMQKLSAEKKIEVKSGLNRIYYKVVI